ncbi:MAG: adenine phosphoribosyltransferase [Elusimicrobia bacterium]|nr:adenine phosphoribosyltransferase [Elusimicrobiota bacterium]
MNLKDIIRNVPDFPKKGIQFKDITTLIQDREAFRESIDWMISLYKDKNIGKVVAVESRGFIFGAPLAIAIGAGLALVRKKGKLPSETLSVKYQLEYGEDELEMHRDTIKKGEKVIIVDDLLATGGTTLAAVQLIEKVPAVISGICFLIELEGLRGRDRLSGYRVESLVKYEGD